MFVRVCLKIEAFISCFFLFKFYLLRHFPFNMNQQMSINYSFQASSSINRCLLSLRPAFAHPIKLVLECFLSREYMLYPFIHYVTCLIFVQLISGQGIYNFTTTQLFRHLLKRNNHHQSQKLVDMW